VRHAKAKLGSVSFLYFHLLFKLCWKTRSAIAVFVVLGVPLDTLFN
jgi:hypothetical protein